MTAWLRIFAGLLPLVLATFPPGGVSRADTPTSGSSGAGLVLFVSLQRHRVA